MTEATGDEWQAVSRGLRRQVHATQARKIIRPCLRLEYRSRGKLKTVSPLHRSATTRQFNIPDPDNFTGGAPTKSMFGKFDRLTSERCMQPDHPPEEREDEPRLTEDEIAKRKLGEQGIPGRPPEATGGRRAEITDFRRSRSRPHRLAEQPPYSNARPRGVSRRAERISKQPELK